MNSSPANEHLRELLRRCMRRTPGIQYCVVDANRTVFEYAAGWADVRNQNPMALNNTLMAYSMTKTFTAATTLQLVERGMLGLDDRIGLYLSNIPYRANISVRQLLSHISGIPNPIPLKWVHLVEDHNDFRENEALDSILRENPKLTSAPGEKYSYSNIGYWLLGKIIERVTDQTFAEYVSENVLTRLGLEGNQMGFLIRDPSNHAKGYLSKYSLTNLLKGFLTDSRIWGDYGDRWLHVRSHYVNGPAFGGLIGSARGFGCFLQDQLKDDSRLLGQETKDLFYTRQQTESGKPIAMTFGWHIHERPGMKHFFKQGGGGGFRSEMRIYPAKGIGTVVMANSTEFRTDSFLNKMDEAFGSACGLGKHGR